MENTELTVCTGAEKQTQNYSPMAISQEIISSLVLNGDMSRLDQSQKVAYYKKYCERLNLDPLTQPFKILRLNGRETLYLDRSGAQQLNNIHKISHTIISREIIQDVGVYMVVARATDQSGRFQESIGAVNIAGMKGDNYANAIMKAETKAQRRATLGLLGIGILDESEVADVDVNAQAEPKMSEFLKRAISAYKVADENKRKEIETSFLTRNKSKEDEVIFKNTVEEIKRQEQLNLQQNNEQVQQQTTKSA